MDFQGNSHPELGKLEQIVSQFFLKALHIVLDSRIPSLQSRGRRYGDRLSVRQVKKSDKWFNLVLGDRPAALDKLHSWQRNIPDSMIIDIILVHQSSESSSADETVIERWVVQYETPLFMAHQSSEAYSYQKMYKKSIILLRSLYLQTRLLPAYRISRQLRSSRYYNVDLIYKVHSYLDPFSGSDERIMKEYQFSPIEAPPGRIRVSVTYHAKLSDFNLGSSVSLPSKIITDYMGSPTTDPMRFCPTPPENHQRSRWSGTSERPHSWTSGFHKPTPHFAENQSFSGTLPYPHLSPGLQDFQSSRSDDDYRELSPPFSLSASPSTPRSSSGGNINMHALVRPGTAPVTIPSTSPMTCNKYTPSNFSDPSRISLPPFSPKSTKRFPSSQDSPSGITQLYRKPDVLRTGDSPSGLMNHSYGHKVVRDSKEDSGRFSGLLSSSGSPRFGFSRSPSRLSSQDDLDDLDFSCPFDFDDVDGSGSQASHSLGNKKTLNPTSQSLPVGRKSQDAAVGVLVQMLRSAPPLRQDSSSYMSFQAEGKQGFGTESEFSLARKTSDALEELRSYKQMKDMLLSKSTTRLTKGSG